MSKMSLSSLSKGKLSVPDRIVIYGCEGVGKSSFAAGAPGVVFLPTEDGTHQLDVARFPMPTTLAEVYEAIDVLTKSEHNYQTLVIDTLDMLEPLIWEAICKREDKESIEDVGGGYGRGYVEAVSEWRSITNALDRLRIARQMRIIMIAHSQIKKFEEPDGGNYDRYELKLNHKAAGYVCGWADTVLFAKYETFTVKEKGQRPKGQSDGSRVMHSTRMAAWIAKSRYGIPDVLPLGWDDYANAIALNEPRDPVEVENEAIGYADKLKDKERGAKAKAHIAKMKGNAIELVKINNQLKTILNKQESVNG